MDRLRAVALALALASCATGTAPSTPPETAAPAEPTAIFPSLAIETGTPPPFPSPTAVAMFTPRAGACTGAAMSTRDMLERYFSLTDSHDPAAVLDCFARDYRERYRPEDMRGSAIQFASQGRLSRLDVRYVDTVHGCDRYAAEFQFETPDPLFPNGFGIFYTVGPDDGMPRIHDGGTGLAAEEHVTVFCG